MRRMGNTTLCAATTLALVGLAAPSPASAGTIVIDVAVAEGDSVPGVGLVTRIDNLVVNDLGNWIVEADTDHANTDADSVLLLNGALYVREGDPIMPSGASVGSFDSVNLNDVGASGWNFSLDGTSGSNDDTGIYFKTELLIQEGTFSTAPQFSPNTPYIGFFECKINADNDILVVASINDPNIPSAVDRALVLLNLDTDGTLLSESVIIKEGDEPSGQPGRQLDDLETSPKEFAFNDNGQYMYIADLSGDTATNSVVYLGTTILAQEGSASPVAGRSYGSLSSAAVDLNNVGGWVIRAPLDGDSATNTVIIRNGATFKQEGDPISTTRGTFSFTSFGTGPVFIGDTGQVLWYGDWDDPDTDVDTGLFLDDQLLVQEGVTSIDDSLVDTLASSQDAFSLSPNGQHIIFEATLADGRNGAFLIDVPVEQCPADLTDDGANDQPDGMVNLFDLLLLLDNWGTSGPGADISSEGGGATVVDLFDLLAMLDAWGGC